MIFLFIQQIVLQMEVLIIFMGTREEDNITFLKSSMEQLLRVGFLGLAYLHPMAVELCSLVKLTLRVVLLDSPHKLRCLVKLWLLLTLPLL